MNKNQTCLTSPMTNDKNDKRFNLKGNKKKPIFFFVHSR